MNCVVIGSDNGLSPCRRQAIIWTNAGILLIDPLGTNFGEILIEIHIFSLKTMHLKMSSAKWRTFCPGRDEWTGNWTHLSLLSSLLRHYHTLLQVDHGVPGHRRRADVMVVPYGEADPLCRQHGLLRDGLWNPTGFLYLLLHGGGNHRD